VRHRDYLAQDKRVRVHSKPTHQLLMLGKPGAAFTFRGGIRVPYEPRPELLAVVISQRVESPKAGPNQVKELLEGLGLNDIQPLGSDVAAPLAQPLDRPVQQVVSPVMVVSHNLESPALGAALKSLRGNIFVEAAGPIARQIGKSIALFTNRIIVRFL